MFQIHRTQLGPLSKPESSLQKLLARAYANNYSRSTLYTARNSDFLELLVWQVLKDSNVIHCHKPCRLNAYQHSKATLAKQQPFCFAANHNQIKKCAGRSFQFRDQSVSPYIGLIRKDKEKDIYYRDGMKQISREQNRYYHCNCDCIKLRHPYFQLSLVHIPVDLQLTNDLKALLEQGVGLKL